MLVSLGDGHLFTYKLKHEGDGRRVNLTDKKTVALGTQPITLTAFVNKGSLNVFAACDRPTVIYSSSRKLLLSNVNQQHVTYMAPFHSSSFPDCLALASESGLLIGEYCVGCMGLIYHMSVLLLCATWCTCSPPCAVAAVDMSCTSDCHKCNTLAFPPFCCRYRR